MRGAARHPLADPTAFALHDEPTALAAAWLTNAGPIGSAPAGGGMAWAAARKILLHTRKRPGPFNVESAPLERGAGSMEPGTKQSQKLLVAGARLKTVVRGTLSTSVTLRC